MDSIKYELCEIKKVHMQYSVSDKCKFHYALKQGGSTPFRVRLKG